MANIGVANWLGCNSHLASAVAKWPFGDPHAYPPAKDLHPSWARTKATRPDSYASQGKSPRSLRVTSDLGPKNGPVDRVDQTTILVQVQESHESVAPLKRTKKLNKPQTRSLCFPMPRNQHDNILGSADRFETLCTCHRIHLDRTASESPLVESPFAAAGREARQARAFPA